MKFNVISIFPNQFAAFQAEGIFGQAVKKGLLQVSLVNPRDFTADVHKTVDDRPFGGGDGMVMLYEPLRLSVEALSAQGTLGRLIYMSPQGETLSQKKVETLATANEPLTLLCGRYGGVDARFIEQFVDEEISIGDYVVSGGELPAMVLMDSVARHVPGVLGHADSAKLESFSTGLLEAPLFTRPREVAGLPVPQVFLEGDHKKIDKLRQALAEVRTRLRRPDLLSVDSNENLPVAVKMLLDLSDAELKSCGLTRERLLEL